LHRAVHELKFPGAAVVGADPARARRDELRAQRADGLIVLQRREHQRRAIGQAVAQLEEVADVGVLAAVRVRQPALVLVILERQRVVPGALGVQQRDSEFADRSGLADLEVVLVERAFVARRPPDLGRISSAATRLPSFSASLAKSATMLKFDFPNPL